MSEMPVIATATRLQWLLRAALTAAVLLVVTVLAATWLVLGRSNVAHPVYSYVDLYRHASSIIALLLAATAFAIAWFARLDRSTVLAAAFAAALALSFAWLLCHYTGAAGTLLDSELGKRSLPWIGAAMAMVHMATPVLFLMFTEVFPDPLPALARARAVLPQLWHGRMTAAGPATGSGWGRPLLTLLWLIACISCAIGPAYGIASALLHAVKALIVICVTVAMALVTARVWRRIEQRTEPTAIERWMVTTGNASGVGALLLLAFIAIALAATLDAHVSAYDDADIAASTWRLYLLGFVVLLACIRPIRAEAPLVFWIGWLVLVIAALPQIAGLGDPMEVEGGYMLLALGYWTVVCLLAGCANLIIAHARGDARARARVQWILAGGVLALFSIAALVIVTFDLRVRCDLPFVDRCAKDVVAFLVLPLAPPTFMTLGMLLAIFASGALDSALALRRTAVFTIVLLIVGALFGMIEGRLEHLLQDVAPGTAKPIAFVASLIVFHPTKHVCEIGVKKALAWMFRMGEHA
jgi:hypothetical protein